MKKGLAAVLVLSLIASMTACSNIYSTSNVGSKSDNSAKSELSPSSRTYGLNDPVTINGITIKISDCKINAVKGDRTSDNTAQDNGPYFAMGSDIKKASDYQQITATLNIVNKTDKAYTFSKMGISAKLQDGTDLNNTIYLNEQNDVQVSSNKSGEYKLNYIISKNIFAKKLNVTYSFLNYNSGWSADLSKAMAGSMTESEYNAKYKPVILNFSVNISK